jgi:CDP-diacylglycerol--glycerol-3-phosphate 3-phosphatidyltransferase
VLRVVLAIVFAAALAPGTWTPLAAFAVAALSDYVDGPLARRAGGPTRDGVVLDSVADIVFVLVACGAGAAQGRLSWVVPLAIACAAMPYLVATLRQGQVARGPARAYSVVGHAAGVCNYALVGLLAGSMALPGAAWTTLVWLGSAVVVALNVAAVVGRLRR